jgi:hypothetical protein
MTDSKRITENTLTKKAKTAIISKIKIFKIGDQIRMLWKSSPNREECSSGFGASTFLSIFSYVVGSSSAYTVCFYYFLVLLGMK